MSNIVKARFCGESKRQLTTEPLYQYDYGQILDVSVIDGLPTSFEVHFCNKGDDDAPASIGLNNRVEIPDAFLETGKYIYAYIYLHDTENDGETEYKISIPVSTRQTVSHDTPTPVQQDEITQLMAALTAGVEAAEQAASVSGYMFFHIDEYGHLIYEHTENVAVDFELVGGHLFVGGA